MKPKADQFALPLDWPQAGDDGRFIISEANREAFEHFRSWSLWPVKATILTGPRRSGRTLAVLGETQRAKRHRRIRARSTTGQVAGAAIE